MTFWEKMKLAGSKILEFFLPMIRKMMTDVGMIALTMALKYVKQIAETIGDADGEAKRKAVIELMIAEARSKGIELSMSVINAAIELAYSHLKEQNKV